MSSNGCTDQQVLRLLLLPIRLSEEHVCQSLCTEFLVELGINAEDRLNWVYFELGRWEEKGTPSNQLIDLMKRILERGGAEYGSFLKESYMTCYVKLKENHFFSHDEARSFLTHSMLMLDLARNERLSAAQIAKLLAQRDLRIRFSRQCVSDFLKIMSCSQSISINEIKSLSSQDRLDSYDVLADADENTAAEFLAEQALKLGFPGNLHSDLLVLFSIAEPDKYIPYIQILHYQCCIAEYYDHAITDIYEFSPRGAAANSLFRLYPQNLASAGNPFLNNAKSVEMLNMAWVRSKKKGERLGAAALLSVLNGLETMGFAARRELGRYLRLWIWRIVQLSEPTLQLLPDSLSKEEWEKVLSTISRSNTKTYGILEQRLVDAIAAYLYPEDEGWRARGLCASVNATNSSQRKFGDCDFQHPERLLISAFEAHGGALSQIYVSEHLRTLKKIISSRKNELVGIADLDKWRVDIIFVAHEISESLEPVDDSLCGLKIKTSYITYEKFVTDALQQKISYVFFDKYILSTLNKNCTPQKVRESITAILEQS